MSNQYREHLARYYAAALSAGMPYGVADSVRRDAQRMHKIAEHECNGVIYRCEEPGQVDHRGSPLVEGHVYSVGNIYGPGPLTYYRTPDRETGCRKRIDAAATAIGATVEYQGDPRGWPVTIRLANGSELNPPVRS